MNDLEYRGLEGARRSVEMYTKVRSDIAVRVEDWSVTDTLGMLRQLGTWRSVLLGIEQWRSLKEASRG